MAKQPAAYAAVQKPRPLLPAFEDSVPPPKEVDAVDQGDVNNAQANVPYLQDIHRHYRESEVSARAQTAELQQHSCYTESAIMPCVRDTNELHKKAASNSLQAVRKKYAQEKHGSVSGIPPA